MIGKFGAVTLNILGFSALAGLAVTWASPSLADWAGKTLEIFSVCVTAALVFATVVTLWRLHVHRRRLQHKAKAMIEVGGGWSFAERRDAAMRFMSGMIARRLIEDRDDFLMVKTECGWVLRRSKPPEGDVWPGVARRIEDHEVVPVAKQFAAEHLEMLMVIDPELNAMRFHQEELSDILNQ